VPETTYCRLTATPTSPWAVCRSLDPPRIRTYAIRAFPASELRRSWLPDLELTERGAAGTVDQVRRCPTVPGEPEFAATGAGRAQVAVEPAACRTRPSMPSATGDIGWPISRNGWRLTEQPHLKFAKLIN
jgi:hypothetical protein